ncbi:hypothetical protein C2S51_003416 [Perilla frutescens var. frutescens]|nr:hypothetical protein C2S51_003416 [Perilla frutescens var. frutescens]
MRASATALISREIAGELGTLTHPFSLFCPDLRNVGYQCRRHFSSLLRLDFSTVKDVQSARFVFGELMRVRPPPSVYRFNKLMSAVVKMEQYTAALSMFDEMRQSVAPMNAYTMNIAINCYCLINRVDFGFAILGCCFKLGYEPDVVTFTTLLKGLCIDDKVIEAEELFSKHALINGLCKGGYTSRACDLLELLETTSCKPNVYDYNALIDSLCKDERVGDALRLLCKMIDNGILPDVVTYSSMIHGLCGVGRWKDVECLLNEMVNRNVSLNVFTFTILVNAHCKEGNMKEAEDVVEVMIRQDISPHVATYNSLIDGYCSQGEMDKAKEIFHSVVDQGLEPNIITYHSLMNGYCTNGKVDEAWCLFLEVPYRGLQHTARTYNIMIHGLFLEGFTEGWNFFSHMEDQQVHPDLVTYTILLDGLLKDHQIDKAFSFLRMTYDTLVKGLCADGRVDAARHIINQLPSKVMQFLKEMIISGFVDDSSTVSMLFDKSQKQKKDEILVQMIRLVVPENVYRQQRVCLLPSATIKEKGPSKNEKWWIPTPKVPPNGLSEVTRKWVQYVLKAAMATNAQVLTEMEIPESYIEALPKNVRASLGDAMYKSITDDFPYPHVFLSSVDLSSAHKILDLKNKIRGISCDLGEEDEC